MYFDFKLLYKISYHFTVYKSLGIENINTTLTTTCDPYIQDYHRKNLKNYIKLIWLH